MYRAALDRAPLAAGWFGNASAPLSADRTFALANVAPGDYMLEVRPIPAPGARPVRARRMNIASVPVIVANEDVDLDFHDARAFRCPAASSSKAPRPIAQQNCPDLGGPGRGRDETSSHSWAPTAATVDADGQFHIPSVYGRVVFRTSALPASERDAEGGHAGRRRHHEHAVRRDPSQKISPTWRLYSSIKQGRIFGFARNQRGEIQYNYRLRRLSREPEAGRRDRPLPAQHEPERKGQFNIGRMPPGEYVGLAVKGVQPGEEWDPELRKRIEQFGKRFTLEEGETLELGCPYVE